MLASYSIWPSLTGEEMRAIIQRVISASVTVNGTKISSIKKGLLVLVGINKTDTKAEREWLIRKLINIRLWPDENGKPWNKSIKDLNYELLLVSQFTLYATMKGHRPDYHLAMAPSEAKEYWNTLIAEAKEAYSPDMVFDGEFGAMMEVELNNDGPVTIPLESPVPQSNNANNKSDKSSNKETQKQKSDETPALDHK